MKGTFNQGWWNCFESFAAELLAVDKYADGVCINVLVAAGITKREASSWLDRTQCDNPKVVDIVREYWLNIQCGTRHDRDVNAAVNIMDTAIEKYNVKQSPAVTGITDADGADSENNTGMQSPRCDYASDEMSMQNVIKCKIQP